MTLETTSICCVRLERRLGSLGPCSARRSSLSRCRLVNRCFAAEEGTPEQLQKTLDQDVSVIDPRIAEASLQQDLKGVHTKEDAERVFAEKLERRLKSGDDIPMVEDFPLAPEEETPDFQHLATTLELRLIRALEHWNGNTHLTLAAIIVRAVEESSRAKAATKRQV